MPRPSTAAPFVLAILLGPSAGWAQAPSASEGPGKPCEADVARLCPGVKPGGGRIGQCLQGKADQISDACKARLEQLKEIHQACHADAEKFCSNVPPGKGRVAVCVQQHETELSPACRTFLQQARARFTEVKKACRDDAARFCANVPPGKGRVAVCLNEHTPDLSEACKVALAARPAPGG